jgi:hypothetical protein
MFASKSLTEHLFRGTIGISAFAGSMMLAPSLPWASLLLIPLALVALRGCPMCWTMGLVQTVIAKVQNKAHATCMDGSCTR